MKARSWAFLAYIGLALGVTMSLGQYHQEQGGLTYWLLILPLALLPLTRPSAMISAALGSAMPAVIFAIVAACWQMARGDSQAALQAVLLGWGLIWAASRAARLKIDDLYTIYLLSVLAGGAVWLFTDLNEWGILPGTTTAAGESVWRVSFFPNIAYTGFFSLIVTMVALADRRSAHRLRKIVLAVALYFVIFSFVRTVLLGLVTFLFLRFLFSGKSNPRRLFWYSLIFGIFVNLAIAYSAAIFAAIQENPLVSRLFLRGESGLSEYEIWQQLYRPYVWGQHFNQFFTSPFLMGWGSTDFNLLKTEDIIQGLDDSSSGDISLPTKLLAQYGLVGAFLIGWWVRLLAEAAKKRDAFICASFPTLMLAMLHWGTMFHPTDAIFGIIMMLMLRGSVSLSRPQPSSNEIFPERELRSSHVIAN
jgi:hypothetical protein